MVVLSLLNPWAVCDPISTVLPLPVILLFLSLYRLPIALPQQSEWRLCSCVISEQGFAPWCTAQAAQPGGALQRAATAVTWEGQKEMTGQAGVTVWQETGLDWCLLAQWNFQKKVHEPQWFLFPTKCQLGWPLRVCLAICDAAYCICLLSQMP